MVTEGVSLKSSNPQGFFTAFGRSHRPGVLRENDMIISMLGTPKKAEWRILWA